MDKDCDEIRSNSYQLQLAVKNKTVAAFTYNGLPYVVNPLHLSKDKNGNPTVVCDHLEGGTDDDMPGNFVTFLVDKIENLLVTEEPHRRVD